MKNLMSFFILIFVLLLSTSESFGTYVYKSANSSTREPVRGIDTTDTTLPSSATPIDGLTVATGDRFLFTNLSSGNNKVYKSNVGSATTNFASYPINTGSTRRTFTGTVFRWAVSFVAPSTTTITSVQWALERAGTPGGNVFITVWSNSGGLPNTLLGTSNLLSTASVPTSAALTTITFGTPVSITSGSTYFVAINVDAGYTYSAGVNSVSSLDATGSPIGGVSNAFYNGTWSTYPQTESAVVSGPGTVITWTAETDGPNQGTATEGSILHVKQGTANARTKRYFDGTNWNTTQYQHLIPPADNTYDLGVNLGNKWRFIYSNQERVSSDLAIINGSGTGLVQLKGATTLPSGASAAGVLTDMNGTGILGVYTPNLLTGPTKDLRIETGNVLSGSTNSGNIYLQTGSIISGVRGDVILNSRLFSMTGSTSGVLSFAPAATTTSHTLTWPSAQGAANTVLTNNGSGTLSWAAASGGSTATTTLTQDQIAMKAYHVANQTGVAITIQTGSQGGVYDGRYLFLSHQTPTAQLSKIDTVEGTVLATSTNVNLSQPMGMAFDGVNLWVAEGGGTVLSKFKASDLSFVANVTVSGCPNRAMVFDGTYIWSGNDCASQIKRVKVSDSTVTTFTIGGSPNYLAFDGTYIWASYSSGTNNLQRIDQTGTVINTYSVGNFPRSITFDGTNLWLPLASAASVVKVKASDGSIVGTYSVGSLPYGSTFDGTYVWVINNSANTVSKVRVSDGVVIGTYPTIAGCIDIWFDGRGVWAVSYSGTSMVRVF